MSFLGLQFAAPARVEALSDENVSRDFGGAFHGVRIGVPWWRVQMQFEPRAFASASPALAIHRNRHGQSMPFGFPMPQPPGDGPAGNVTAQAAAAAGAATVSLASDAGTVAIAAGRFVAFAGHTKVYQVTEAVDGASPAEVAIFPALLTAVAAGEAVAAEPMLRCVYETGSGGAWELDGRNVVAPRIAVVEA